MNYSYKNSLALLTALLLGVLISLAPSTLCAAPAEKAVLNAADDWAKAIGSRNPDTIAALYDPGAVLWATFSTTRFSTPKQIHAYFVNLTKRKDLKATFTSHLVRMHDDVAVDTGYYYFSFTENGKTVKVPARYTFAYKRTASGWKIIEHHSSVVPPGRSE